MSILIENIPIGTDVKKLKKIFKKFGSCSIDLSFKEAIINFSYIKDAVNAYIQVRKIPQINFKMTPLFKIKNNQINNKFKQNNENEAKYTNEISVYQRNHLLKFHLNFKNLAHF